MSRWGSLRGGPLSFGGAHYRLVVLPPGTNLAERRLFHLLAWWPALSLASTPIALLVLHGFFDTSEVLSGCVLASAAGYLTLRHTLRRQRRDVCVVDGGYITPDDDPAERMRCARMVILAATLRAAEQATERGDLPPVAFELLWGHVHDAARDLNVGGHELGQVAEPGR